MTSKFILNSKETIEVNQIFLKIGEIKNECIIKKLMQESQYEIQSPISYEVFQSFINYLTTGEIPDVHIDNIFEYSLINQEFKIDFIQNILQNKKNQYRQLERILESNNNENKENEIEKSVIQLYQIARSLKGEIDKLKIEMNQIQTDLKNLKTNQGIKEEEQQEMINNKCETEIKKSSDNLKNIIDMTKEELSLEIDNIKKDLQLKSDKNKEQDNKSQDHQNLIKKLENQINLLHDDLKKHKEENNQLENDTKKTLGVIKIIL